MANSVVVKHPLVAELITNMRDNHTNSQLFRIYSKQITTNLLFEALKDLKTKKRTVRTQTGLDYTGAEVAEKVAFISILRASLGMLSTAMEVFPQGEFHTVGIKRNEEDPFTNKPNFYLDRLNEISKNSDRIVVMDPMLATGGSLIAVLTILREKYNFKCKIQVICFIAAEPGVKAIEKLFPDVTITCAGLDAKLNEKAFIIPGLGDAGDKFFGIATDLATVR